MLPRNSLWQWKPLKLLIYWPHWTCDLVSSHKWRVAFGGQIVAETIRHRHLTCGRPGENKRPYAGCERHMESRFSDIIGRCSSVLSSGLHRIPPSVMTCYSALLSFNKFIKTVFRGIFLRCLSTTLFKMTPIFLGLFFFCYFVTKLKKIILKNHPETFSITVFIQNNSLAKFVALLC